MVGDPPYRVCIDAGHGGSDPGARGVVEEKEMTAQTSEALLALLEADPNYIPLRSRESYDVTAKPSERAEAINAQSPQLLLSIHGNSAPEGSTAAGFECYPSVPGRTWHQESYYFAQQLAQGMFFAAKLCNVLFAGHKALFCQNRRTVYIFQQGKASLVPYFGMGALYELLYLALIINVPDAAVAAKLCACGLHCKTVARAYYEAICAYFGTQPLDTPL